MMTSFAVEIAATVQIACGDCAQIPRLPTIPYYPCFARRRNFCSVSPNH